MRIVVAAQWTALWVALGIALGAWGCSKKAPDEASAPRAGSSAPGEGGNRAAAPEPAAPARPKITDAVLSRFGPLPSRLRVASRPLTDARVELGRMLYFDKRFSKRHDRSCDTCHPVATYGVDGQATSAGYDGQRTRRNAPSAFHAAGHARTFWDGRAADVEEGIAGHVLDPTVMGMKDAPAVEAVAASMPAYVEAFQRAFPEAEQPVTQEHFAVAIGSFLRTLSTPGRFDQFLRGDPKALSDAEVAGFKAFVDHACTSCHDGPLVGGRTVQKLGRFKPYPGTGDRGRAEATGKPEDAQMFRVPSLRNVEKTGPWFHDGSVGTLEKAVELMAWHQVGKKLDAETIGSIVTFLRALTGEVPQPLTEQPALPPSTEKTPTPD